MQAAMSGLQTLFRRLRPALCLPQILATGQPVWEGMEKADDFEPGDLPCARGNLCFPRNVSFLSAGEEVCGDGAQEEFSFPGFVPILCEPEKGSLFLYRNII